MQLMKLQVDDEINIDESRKHLRSIHKESGADANELDTTRVLSILGTINSKCRPKKRVSLFTEYSLYYSRIMDISKVCELRKYDIEGHREVILLLYRYF